MGERCFVVGRRDADQTLAAFLRARLGLSWSQTKRLIESGRIRIGTQKVVDPAYRLKLGKTVSVHGESPLPLPRRARQSSSSGRAASYTGPVPEIVYSDDAVVVVNKPPGLTTMRHREEAEEFGPRGRAYLPATLADLLPAMLGQPGRPVRAVHRIDRDTSGLVVFARTASAARKLEEQFRAHTVEREYLALVRGQPVDRTIASRLVRDRGDGRRGSGPEGLSAVTHVHVRQRFAGFALVACRLETGRTHQVRIHLGEAGWPLCGERVYDRPLHGRPLPDGSGALRPMLHAARLGFIHPVTGERMAWSCDPPSDFQAIYRRVQNAADG